MPIATVSGRTVRKELTSCPGGWVELKQLTYDQMLERRDNATKMFMESSGDRRDAQTTRMSLQIANRWSVTYDFRHCIVDHNLEDEKGEKLDLANPLVFQILDPKVGTEVEQYIDELNQPMEADMSDFLPSAFSSSTETSDSKESQNGSEQS